MSIRTAQVEDAEAVSALVSSLAHRYLEHPDDSLPVWLSESLEPAAFRNRFADANFLNLVHCEHGVINGYIALRAPNHLYHLFVAERAQGKGIARALWESLVGSSSASCFQVRSSLYAIPVYQRFGFNESGPIGEKDGVRFQPMHMGRTSHALSELENKHLYELKRSS